MKVVSSKQMSEIESQAYRDGASETDFMEEAGSGIALVVHDYVEDYDLTPHVILLCGKGNNTGDAYVAGIHLMHLDYKAVAYQLEPIDNCTPLCKQNCSRFAQEGGTIIEVTSTEDIVFSHTGVIIDGLFGTGLHGSIEEPYISIIRIANASGLPIIAVDIPSGLNGETGKAADPTIMATKTVFLGLPKTGFFLCDGWDHVGKLHYVDFGLNKKYIESSHADFIMLSADMMKPLVPVIRASRHKYEAGYVVGLAGSPGMPGAAILSSLAALRGGAGIVRLLHPDEMQAELASSPYELVKIPYTVREAKSVIDLLNSAHATFIGPGLGLDERARKLLKQVLAKIEKPSVIDADALTIIAEEKLSIPRGAVLTPHFGELKRLLNLKDQNAITTEFLLKCQAFVEKSEITLVLKGGPTYVFHPKNNIIVSPSGDPGMATAGSGDVLTGLIASFLSQGLAPYKAACLGVYIHGIAGERAAEELTSPCMVASDIIEYFPDAFNSVL